jgi:hypothetical protein
MDKYINQLIEDLLAAQRVEKVPHNNQINDIEAHFADVERYVSGDYDQKIGDVIGFYEEQFPPIERLNQAQMQAVAGAFEQLLNSYGVELDLPSELPIEKRYQLIISTINREVYIGDSGCVTLEFCHYDPTECPLGEEYCRCKDVDIDDMDDANYSEKDLPF